MENLLYERIANAFSSTRRRVNKYDSYMKSYSEILGPYLLDNKPVKLLEVGVQDGGSLEAWQALLGNDSIVVGLDLNPECKKLELDGFKIHIGDQSDSATWKSILAEHGTFDILIDDGSHIGFSQVATVLFGIHDIVRPGGVIIIEDTHASYMNNFTGRLTGRNFIDFANEVAGCIHSRSAALRCPDSMLSYITHDNIFRRHISSIHVYESIYAFKVEHNIPDSKYLRNPGSANDGSVIAGDARLNSKINIL